MFFGAKKIIGLDIGSSTIKMAEFDIGKSSAQLVSFGFLPTPQGAVGGGDINNIPALSEAVRTLAMQIKTKRKLISTGMWGTSVIVKKVTMPRIEKNLIQQQVRWEAEQYIPFDLKEVSLTYNLINIPGANDTMDILLIAAQNAMVTQYAQIIVGAGFEVGVLDVSGFALANTFELNYGKMTDRTVALLNIGAGITNFVVVSSGEVVFARDIPFGGSNYTMEIHKEMGVTIPEAEALKLSAMTGNEVPEQVHSVIKSVNGIMVDELRNSFDFFSASSTGFTISQCYYTGGASGIKELIPAVSQATGVPFESLNPFLRVKAGRSFTPEYLQQIAPFVSIVIGLGIRKVGDA